MKTKENNTGKTSKSVENNVSKELEAKSTTLGINKETLSLMITKVQEMKSEGKKYDTMEGILENCFPSVSLRKINRFMKTEFGIIETTIPVKDPAKDRPLVVVEPLAETVIKTTTKPAEIEKASIKRMYDELNSKDISAKKYESLLQKIDRFADSVNESEYFRSLVKQSIDITSKAIETSKKAVTPAPVKVAKVKKETAISFEDVARQLVADKTSEKAILATFVRLYAAKGQNDLEYIKKRVAIYVKIANKK